MRSADERIQAMLKGRRAVREVPVPGLDPDSEIRVGVRLLTDDEIDQARGDAMQYVDAVAKRFRVSTASLLDVQPEMLDRENQRMIIYRAFLDLDREEGAPDGVYKPFFMAPQAVRQLDSEMVQTLYAVYVEHQEFVNPQRSLTREQCDELVEALGKGQGAEAVLALYDASSLRILVRILVAQLQSSATGKSDSGGRVDSPTSKR